MQEPPADVAGADHGVEILDKNVAFDGYFQIVRYHFRHRQFGGGMGGVLTREVFERGHAVAVLPYDPIRDQVALIEQFRIGAHGVVDEPWLLEPVAGIIEPGEAIEAVAHREAAEEAGVTLLELVPMHRYFVSPGGTTESCQLYLGRADLAAAGGVFGLADEGEDIRVHVLDTEVALAGLGDGRYRVATTIIALQWLALNRATLRARWARAGGPT